MRVQLISFFFPLAHFIIAILQCSKLHTQFQSSKKQMYSQITSPALAIAPVHALLYEYADEGKSYYTGNNANLI